MPNTSSNVVKMQQLPKSNYIIDFNGEINPFKIYYKHYFLKNNYKDK